MYQLALRIINSPALRRVMFMAVVFASLLSFSFSAFAENISGQTQRLLGMAPDKTRQVIVVFVPNAEEYGAELTCFEQNNGHWRRQFSPMPALIGRAGLAGPNEKREGDGKTPQGMYDLRFTFGQKKTPPGKMPYRLMQSDDFWIDDPSSPFYNTLRSGNIGSVSAERMKLNDGTYDLGLLIEYNTNPIIPGLGSAIFMHIWQSPQKSTQGCVALDRENLALILAWLDPEKKPVIIISGNSVLF